MALEQEFRRRGLAAPPPSVAPDPPGGFLTGGWADGEKYQTPATINITATTQMATNFILLGGFGGFRNLVVWGLRAGGLLPLRACSLATADAEFPRFLAAQQGAEFEQRYRPGLARPRKRPWPQRVPALLATGRSWLTEGAD